MDISSVIGIILGIGFVIGSIMMGGSIKSFVDLHAILIVLGGCIASSMIAFPLKDFLSVFKTSLKVFVFKIRTAEEIINNLVEISNKARKGGLLSIENDIPATSDPYLAHALQMTVDGVKTADIAAIMQKKMSLTKRNLETGVKIFQGMGALAPSFGLIGTIIGLVQMLANLDDPSSIGPSMSVAMIATFYGAVLANLVFIPMAEKLSGRNEEEIINMNIIFEGVISIREGEHPKLMEDKLRIYLNDHIRENKEITV